MADFEICFFCGGNSAEPDHWRQCAGRGTMARNEDPDTSHAAAASWSLADLTEVQQRVYAIHQQHPRGLTDEELLHRYLREHITAESSPRKRRCDLTRLGVIMDSGERRVLVSGRNGIVWKLR
jgi:hypothetical protein